MVTSRLKAELTGTLSPCPRILLKNNAAGEEVPALLLMPKDWNHRAVVWVSRRGKQSLFDAHGKCVPAVETLLDAHAAVLGLDLLGQGEFTVDGKSWKKARINEGEKKI